MIPVFFSIDNNYAPYLSVALASAIENSNPLRRYKAIVLHQDLAQEHQDRIRALAQEHFSIEFCPMKRCLACITDQMSNRLRCDYFTLTIYFRLFIPTMFPQYDKAIYIDSDVVVQGDLAELFETELGENYFGACVETSVGDVPELTRYMKEAVGVEHSKYINSGVLLMNLKQLREKKLDEHFLHLLNQYHFDSVAPDQDYLNALCYGKILYLPQTWNTTPNENRPTVDNAKLIHYNLFSKPWCYDGVQYEDVFWRYAQSSHYLADIRAHKAAYSPEKKASDKKCMERMVQRGLSIAAQDVTFRKMQESGVRIRL